jgi:phosphatidylglycerophosphate synthase
VVSGFFATGWWPLMIVGAIGVQASIIIDCADGEVARFTGVSSQFGAWLDAATDRIKEYGLYAGLAFGASQHGLNLWPLALG